MAYWNGSMRPRLALGTAQATRTQASAQVAFLLHTLRSHLKEKRLLFFTIASFLSLYAIAACVLLARGLALIRWLRRDWLKPQAVALIGGLIVLAAVLWPAKASDAQSAEVAANVAHILQLTDPFTHPLLPSSWGRRRCWPPVRAPRRRRPFTISSCSGMRCCRY